MLNKQTKGGNEMKYTSDKNERREQKEFLKNLYPDYDAKRHDAFVARYNNQAEAERVNEYMKNRGII